jgi:hypothetical protein
LLAAAAASGAAALILVEAGSGRGAGALVELGRVLSAAAAVLGLVLVAELGGHHPNVDAARAARVLTHAFRARFWAGVVVAGIIAPAVLAVFGGAAAVAAAVLALAGLWVYEDLWIKAGQSIPLS